MSDFSWNGLTVMGPELFLALAGMILLVVGVFRREGGAGGLGWMTAGVFLAGIYLLYDLAPGSPAVVMNGFFLVDPFATFMKSLVLLGMAAATVLSIRYVEQERMARFEYPILMIFAGLGMMMMISANNLLAMYMGFELQSLSLYVLAAIRRDHAKSSEAGLKYFVLGALASGMMLFGSSLIYGYTGSIGFEAIGQSLSTGAPGVGLTVGLVFVLAGIAFKVSAVPFHMWTPDVYEGAPTSVTALFAIVPKLAAMAFLMRFVNGPFAAVLPQWQQILWFLSAASMIVGAFAAIAQSNIKRLLAYSAIGNMGYALIGVAAGTQAGAAAVIVYMAIYMVMSVGVFGIILAMRRGGLAVEGINDLAGLSRTQPLTAWCMAFLMFSMSGIPPLAGFFGKLFVFQAAMAAHLYVLAVLGVLSSVVAAYYYLKIIKIMFFDEPAESLDRGMAWGLRAMIAASIVFVIFFVFSPNMLVASSGSAAAALFPG